MWRPSWTECSLHLEIPDAILLSQWQQPPSDASSSTLGGDEKHRATVPNDRNEYPPHTDAPPGPNDQPASSVRAADLPFHPGRWNEGHRQHGQPLTYSRHPWPP